LVALALEYFTEDEMVKLTLAVVTINGWIRLTISFRSEPGVYQPAQNQRTTQKTRSAA
jgi:hypothetical protein